ncbi:hypothetical protein [Cellulomonas marina]|uniref:Alpha-1,2-mannosyltransferase n=1 Tax=Cellulomonas marina TaxID=988821 RepID=A0A1I1AAN0_9CELL|nr:hypothetical protein [Cellulomonas marina]GIG29595.1 hypothetical protein Cma02nite_21950 [Cellulomonas marina]SFB33568.1 Protein of unknown function [Cellulomonas marina]
MAALLGSRRALWAAFGLVHGWLLLLGVVLVPDRAFWDLSLYRYWVGTGLAGGAWPVLDDPWVYPAGALVPMLVAALGGTGDGPGYGLAWSLMVTALDALAVLALLRVGRRRATGLRGAWWWVAFLALLGPVAMGRLDAVVAPLTVLALVGAARAPGAASALLTAGAWVKVTPGALLLPLVLTVRRPVRQVVLPALAACAVVVGAVAAGGGLPRVATFLSAQDGRGLQLEAVGATPWVLAGLVTDAVHRYMDQGLVTWQLEGGGAEAAAGALGVLMAVAVAAAAALLVRARRRSGDAFAHARVRLAFVLRGSMLLTLLLIVTNKVGSPQYVGWLAAPVAVALTVGLPRWGRTAAVLLGTAAATQVVFPWVYTSITQGAVAGTLVLAARNVALVWLTAETALELVADVHRARGPGALTAGAAPPPRRRAPGAPGPSGPAPAGTPG